MLPLTHVGLVLGQKLVSEVDLLAYLYIILSSGDVSCLVLLILELVIDNGGNQSRLYGDFVLLLLV